MAKLIKYFEDNSLNEQFLELIRNLEHYNFKYDAPTVQSDEGKVFKLKVDEDGNLSTEEVE